jgi:hypothetical protein
MQKLLIITLGTAMNLRKGLWQANIPQICNCRELKSATLFKNPLRNILWILGALLVSSLIVSCASQPPKYEAYPTLSMRDRLEGPGKKSDNPFNWWTTRFNRELARMAANEWNPSTDLLNKTLGEVAGEYGVLANEPPLPLVQKAFIDKFKLDEDDPNCNGVMKGVVNMVHLIDLEHPNLLVNISRLKTPPAVDRYGLLSLVSAEDPVGVALTRWATLPPQEGKPGGPNIVIIGNTVVTSSELSRILAPEGKPSESEQAGVKKDVVKEKDEKPQTEPKKKLSLNGDSVKQSRAKKDDSNEKDGKSEQTKKKPILIEDFKPEQRVTLSLSTVLNSPVVLDRIEYVSTYLYLQAFPFPPNGDVVIEKEFWRSFFALNSTRDSLVKKETVANDMRRAIEDMRVRIINADTTVKLQELDFGSLTRKTSDKLTAEIAATAAFPPTLTSITPKLGYSSGVDTEATMKLQQQLDQRSTYVDPSGHFLRITQRGMQSVNLAGRFVENITLSIPSAQNPFPVLVPVQKSATDAIKYALRWLSEPLYSRVDALTLSVVVARQATALVKSTKDSFRLDDPKDAAFIVGVTQPYRITLWQNEREMCEVMLTEIFGNEKDLPENQKVFFTTFEKERPTPLRLFGFSSEQQHELLRKLQKLATDNNYGVVSLPIDSDIMITIGLPDDPRNPTKLVGFKKKS